MRFAKMKGGADALEAHHERTKVKYASNPYINIERSKYNFHIVKPETSYKRESDSRIEAVGCNTRKDSVRFVDSLPEEIKRHFNQPQQAQTHQQ